MKGNVYLVFLILITIGACKEKKEQAPIQETVEVETKIIINDPCVKAIIERDSVLGKARNHYPEKFPISAAVNNYVIELLTLDYTNCPIEFKTAFMQHVSAWKRTTPLLQRYDNLRGEMHDVFDQIETGKDSVEFKKLVKDIWDTWDAVEQSIPG